MTRAPAPDTGVLGSERREMNAHLLYAAVDGAAIALLLLLAVRLLALAPRNRNAQLIASAACCTACAVVSVRHSHMAALPSAFAVDLGLLTVPVSLGRNLTAGVVTVLCHSIFRPGKRLPPLLLLGIWALQILLEEPLEWLATPGWALAQPVAAFVLYEVAPSVLQIVLLGFAVTWAVRDSQADTSDARRKMRAVLVVASAVLIALGLLVDRLGVRLWEFPTDVFPVHVGITTIGLLMTGGVVLLFLRSDWMLLFLDPAGPAPALAVAGVPSPASDVARLQAAFESEHVHRRPGLTVGVLAGHLKMPEYRLRSLIRRDLGFRNFNALLHHYRVAEVSAALADPDRDDTPVLTLALSAGYQSITAFNRAFRALHGMTPTQFRARRRRKPADS